MRNREAGMLTQTRRLPRALVLGAAVLATISVDCPEALADKPNVVVLFIDDLGWKDLGVYGSKFFETPRIDQLAKQGALFTRAYSSCNVCSPP